MQILWENKEFISSGISSFVTSSMIPFHGTGLWCIWLFEGFYMMEWGSPPTMRILSKISGSAMVNGLGFWLIVLLFILLCWALFLACISFLAICSSVLQIKGFSLLCNIFFALLYELLRSSWVYWVLFSTFASSSMLQSDLALTWDVYLDVFELGACEETFFICAAIWSAKLPYEFIYIWLVCWAAASKLGDLRIIKPAPVVVFLKKCVRGESTRLDSWPDSLIFMSSRITLPATIFYFGDASLSICMRW